MSLSRRELVAIAALMALGFGLRCWIAATSYGVRYDTDTASIVARLLASHPLHAYGSLRYPYPGGFLPVLLLSRWIAHASGVAFSTVWKLPAVLADMGIAGVLAWGLGRMGAGGRERVVTVGLVALGPIFVIVSGFHGQIDAVAILPALIAVIVWRLGGEDRAWWSGLLIGLGAAIKTVPLFMALALLPTVRSRREGATLVSCAVAVPLASVLPFLVADPHDTYKSLTSNVGVPGIGGPSVFVQPGLLHGWLHGRLPAISGATHFFTDRQNEIVGVAVLLAGAFAWRKRMDPVSAAALIWLTVYTANFNWAFQYWIWGLPFFLLIGWRLRVAGLQALLVIPAVELYFHFHVSALGWSVLPLTIITWCALAAALFALVWRWRRVRPRAAVLGVAAPARPSGHGSPAPTASPPSGSPLPREPGPAPAVRSTPRPGRGSSER